MHFLKLTINNSYWRGHDYYLNKNVLSWSKESENIYCGKVKGNNGNIYDVRINSLRGKKSTCNCEFAKGRYVVCKHMVALYLTVFPGKDVEREEYYEKEYNDYILQLNKEKENKKTEIVKYVKSLSKKELQEELLERMLSDLEEDYNQHYW